MDPAIGEAVVAAGGQPGFWGLMASMPYGITNALMIPERFSISSQNGIEVADAVNGEQSIEEPLEKMQAGITRVLGDAGYYG